MVKVKSYFDREKVIDISKKTQKKSLIMSSILAVIMFIVGILNVFMALNKDKTDWFAFVLGLVITVISLIPLFSSIKNYKNAGENAVKEMGVEKDSLTLEYLFKDKRIELTITRGDNVSLKTVMIKNVTKVQLDKNGIAIYLTDNDMFYIPNEDIIEGDKKQLISIFIRNNVTIK